jgi:multidrug efflux pump subunit AcrA (membrane-fusion protein)
MDDEATQGWEGRRDRGSRRPGIAFVLLALIAIVAGREHTWSGDLVGTTGRVDPASGTVSLIVQVRQPLDVPAGRAPLLPGMVVEVLVPVTEPNTQKVGDL